MMITFFDLEGMRSCGAGLWNVKICPAMTYQEGSLMSETTTATASNHESPVDRETRSPITRSAIKFMELMSENPKTTAAAGAAVAAGVIAATIPLVRSSPEMDETDFAGA